MPFAAKNITVNCFGISLVNIRINRKLMAAWRKEISVLVFTALTREIFFNTYFILFYFIILPHRINYK